MMGDYYSLPRFFIGVRFAPPFNTEQVVRGLGVKSHFTCSTKTTTSTKEFQYNFVIV